MRQEVSANEQQGKLIVSDSADPNNVKLASEEEGERDYKKRMFWQVAALHGMDVRSTFNFCKEFVYGNELTMQQTEALIDHYRSEITTASGVVNTIVTNSFENLSLIKRAETINRGLRTTMLIIEATEQATAKMLANAGMANNNRNADRVSRLAVRNKQLADTYAKWNTERESWQKDAENMLTEEAYTKARISGVSEHEQRILDVSKIRSLMVQRGVDPNIADALAGLIATGDYFLNEKEKEDTSRYLATNDELEDMEDV